MGEDGVVQGLCMVLSWARRDGRAFKRESKRIRGICQLYVAAGQVLAFIDGSCGCSIPWLTDI